MKGIWSGASGAAASWTHIELLSHDLANASTVGFKASRASFMEAGRAEGGPLGMSYAEIVTGERDLSSGALEPSTHPYDLALQGNGYFQVETLDGERMLTRDGRFRVDDEGYLVSRTGNRLLGSGGPIQVQVQMDETLEFTMDGEIVSDIQGPLGFLPIVDVEAEPVGGNLWRPTADEQSYVTQTLTGQAEGATTIHQGFLERSNVDPMRAMVELVQATRYFEAYQKVMQASDDISARLQRAGRT